MTFYLRSVKFLSNDMKKSFYKLSEKVDIILRNNNIRYFIICGTLLGSVREGEMIPWDDDIDIGILEEDLPAFYNINFENYGLKHRGVNPNGIGKIFYDNNKDDSGEKMNSIFIDVFIFKKENNKYIYSQDWSRKKWPNEFFYEQELFPLKIYKFGNIKLQGPNQYKMYCERAWGKNWNIPPFFKSKLYYIKKLIQ